MKIHIYHHGPADEVWRRNIQAMLDLILTNQESIMATIADVQAAVARETDAETSVLTLLAGISQQLKDAQASSDPAALQAVIDQIDANTAKLSQAVVANTPAAPAAPSA